MDQTSIHSNPDSSFSDETMLLQGLSAGDPRSFAELYKRFQPRLLRFLYPFAAAEDAKEIIQDIFLKLWEKREDLTGIRNIEPYLYRMARNRLIDRQKADQARQGREQRLHAGEARQSDQSFELAEYREMYEAAIQVIRSLPERQQIIYRLRIFEDHSLDEIAEKLSLSKAVVIKQLYLANRSVREGLRDQGYSGTPLVSAGLLFLHQLFS